MDQTDLNLCRLLLVNSRTPVRELGDKLGLSIAAVHGRIETLRHLGVIKAFTARVGIAKLQATTVLVWGTPHTASNEEVRKRLSRDEHVYWIALGGAGVVYVGLYLRQPAELDGCVSSVTKEAGFVDPTVALIGMGSGLPDAPVLDRVDARILHALRRDARKSIADVAEEIGLSAKTVGRRLGRMMEDGSAEFSMEWYPDAANDVISMWHLELRPTADRDEAVAVLWNRYLENLLFAWPPSNLPRLLLAATWTASAKEMRDVHLRLEKEEPFVRIVPNTLYTGYMCDTWRDALLTKWAAAGSR